MRKERLNFRRRCKPSSYQNKKERGTGKGKPFEFAGQFLLGSGNMDFSQYMWALFIGGRHGRREQGIHTANQKSKRCLTTLIGSAPSPKGQ